VRPLVEQIEAVLGVRPRRAEPLGGGCVASVVRADLPDGSRVVVKADPAGASGLSVEAASLRYLAEHTRLPVPRVLGRDGDRLLILEYVEHRGGSGRADEHAAELLADLHGISAPAFGFETDTRIGGLVQPGGWSEAWPEFFGRCRLAYMSREAHRAGRLSERAVARVEHLAARLDRLLPHKPRPSLIHGDVWSGNVLADGDRVAAFIDPAIYFADAEVELAFIALFNCFGDAFWRRYHELRPIDPAFFTTRRDLYNLYPLLVHTRLFGGGYAAQVESTLARYR
jgi:fructosamine-3-kinase